MFIMFSPSRLLPFGSGKRMCLGEGVAKQRLFIVPTTLLQSFEFLPPSPEEIPQTDPRQFDLKLVLCPPSFRVKVIPRSSNNEVEC